jgi:hypothetical protein
LPHVAEESRRKGKLSPRRAASEPSMKGAVSLAAHRPFERTMASLECERRRPLQGETLTMMSLCVNVADGLLPVALYLAVKV